MTQKDFSSQRPALLGGSPVRPEGPPDWPGADADVRAALDEAFQSGDWGKYHGAALPAFEAALREYHHVDHVLTCGSGTFAVELALRALKVGAGDEVMLAGYDYPGNFFAVHAVGAMPVLADLDPIRWQLNLENAEGAIGPHCKTIIASHLHGGLIPMRQLMDLARRRGLTVVEDAAQCPGAVVEGRKAGTWGDVGVLSFGGSKLLTAGRGGALLFRDEEVWQRARAYQVRGNVVCPLSELQAAVLRPQLAKLDERNARRRESVALLREGLREIPGLRLLAADAGADLPTFYKVGMQFDAMAFGLDRALLVKALRAEGIALDEGFNALHVGRSPRRFRAGDTLSEAQRAHEGCVVLHHPILLEGEPGVAQVVRAIAKVWALLARRASE